MKPEDLKKLIDGKRRWTEPLSPEDQARGFKGWYSSKYLPHFDSPGAQQYITFRLADSLPSGRRGEWEAILSIEDDLEKQRRLEHTSTWATAPATCESQGLPKWSSVLSGITTARATGSWFGS